MKWKDNLAKKNVLLLALIVQVLKQTSFFWDNINKKNTSFYIDVTRPQKVGLNRFLLNIMANQRRFRVMYMKSKD